MTTVEQERHNWQHDADHLNAYVDHLIDSFKEAGADPAAWMLIDLVFRPYLQWIHSAQLQKIEAQLATNAVVNLVNLQMIEILTRTCREQDGVDHAMAWVDKFNAVIRRECERDLVSHFGWLRAAQCPQ